MTRMDQITGSETILVVDDDGTARRALCRTLEYHGYRALQAATGDAAIELLGRDVGEIDLLLVDVTLPRATEASLARRLRTAHPATRVLYTSRPADGGARDPAGGAGRTHVLENPLTIRQLSVEIRRILDDGRDPRRSPARAGFTLVEMIVASLVLATGLLGLGATTGFLVRQTAVAEVVTRRTAARQNVMEQLRSLPYDSVETGGRTVGGYEVGWSVTEGADAKEVEVETVGPGLRTAEGDGLPRIRSGVADTLTFRIVRLR